MIHYIINYHYERIIILNIESQYRYYFIVVDTCKNIKYNLCILYIVQINPTSEWSDCRETSALYCSGAIAF